MKETESSMHLGLQGLTSNTIQFGRDGVAGVKKGRLILFKHLEMMLSIFLLIALLMDEVIIPLILIDQLCLLPCVI